MREPLPLATIQNRLFEFLRGRTDLVVFGAQAVNAYVAEPRMTQDIDVMSSTAKELAEEICEFLRREFHTAVRVRQVAGGMGYRVYQSRKAGPRHLVDVRSVTELPPSRSVAKVRVIEVSNLIAMKVISYSHRRGSPKAGTDWRDLAMLLLAYPEFKREDGEISAILDALGADVQAKSCWRDLVAAEIVNQEDDF